MPVALERRNMRKATNGIDSIPVVGWSGKDLIPIDALDALAAGPGSARKNEMRMRVFGGGGLWLRLAGLVGVPKV